jgi:ABC-2 type transport system permease protein
MWLVGLWPLSRGRVMWAKFLYALTVTTFAALGVTILSIRALDLPWTLGVVQAHATLATCVGLCGLAVGLGARLPSYRESNSGRIAAGLGGTVNLIASVALVAVNVGLFGVVCLRQVGAGRLDRLDGTGAAVSIAIVLIGVITGLSTMQAGIRSFSKQEF